MRPIRSHLAGGALCALGLASLLLAAPGLEAASPAAGTVSEAAPQVSWTGGPKLATAAADCGGPDNGACDNFKLTVEPPPYAFTVEIRLTPQLVDDYDLQVWSPQGQLADSSGNNPGQPEIAVLDNPAAGTYTVSAAPFAVTSSYSATARIVRSPGGGTPPAAGPRYANYAAPAGMGRAAGEPTLGVNFETGKVMYISNTETLRVSFDDCSSPAAAGWEDASFLTTSLQTFDPILWTDQELGRTFVSQLLPSKMSLMAFTDDDGATWTPSQGSGINSGVDHQSVGGGPFAPGLLQPLTDYSNILYYCSQDVALAQCAASLDGGLTFGPAVPIYNLLQCGGLHGHVKVGPDGTAYVPNKACNGEQGVSVSHDNGLTWEVRTVPGSTAGDWDPSVATAADGTVYFGYGNGDGHPSVAVSHDEGRTWSNIQDVGAAFGIRSTAFPVIVAGDGDRAAFAFLGTTATGDVFGDDPSFPAVWYLYVAHTYDGGQTWVTVEATPGDPVQRGTICAGGPTGCPNGTRNLLDFMDVTVDREGRALVAFADGCVGSCVEQGPNSGSEVATISRQSSGLRLFAAHDVVGAPAAPAVEATLAGSGTGVRLSWSTSDEHGSPVTGYRIYRRTASGSFALLASVGADVHSFDDAAGTADHRYQVKAVNAHGEGPACREAAPVVPPPPPPSDPCVPPGAQVAADGRGDVSFPGTAQHDLLAVSVGEPYFEDGSQKLAFTLEVADLSSLPLNTIWRTQWVGADGVTRFVELNTSNPLAPACEYGFLDGNLYTGEGAADGCAHSPVDNTLTVTVATAKVGGPAAGSGLGGVTGRSEMLVGAAGTGALVLVDDAGPGSYVLRGNAACASGTPVAADDSAATRENRPVTLDVLANDSDPDGDALAIAELGAPAHGRAVAKKGGLVSYKPDQGFTGADSFRYTVTDGRGNSATATVTITVQQR